jgi:hypothetical protein
MNYTFMWQVLDFAVEFTGLSKLHNNGGPKPFCWAKLACFDFSWADFHLSGHTYWALVKLLLRHQLGGCTIFLLNLGSVQDGGDVNSWYLLWIYPESRVSGGLCNGVIILFKTIFIQNILFKYLFKIFTSFVIIFIFFYNYLTPFPYPLTWKRKIL